MDKSLYLIVRINRYTKEHVTSYVKALTVPEKHSLLSIFYRESHIDSTITEIGNIDGYDIIIKYKLEL